MSKHTRTQLTELGSASIQPGKALPSSKACSLAHLYPSDLLHQKTEKTSLPQDSPTGLYCCWKSCSKLSSVGFEVLLNLTKKQQRSLRKPLLRTCKTDDPQEGLAWSNRTQEGFVFNWTDCLKKSVLQKLAQKDERPKLRPKTTYKILRRKQI